MPGMYKYSMEIESNVKKLLLDTKELQDRMDTLEGKEYKINLNIDEKKLGNVISNLEKMLDSLGKGTGDFKQFENLSKELSSIVSEVQSLSKAFGKVDDSGAKTLLSSIQNIDKSLSELSQNILNVNKNMSNMGGNTSGAVKQVENITNESKKAASALEDVSKAQAKVNGQKTNISSGSNSPVEVTQNNNISDSIQKKKEALASYELQLEETRYEVEKLSNAESKLPYGFNRTYNDKKTASMRDRVTDIVLGNDSSSSERSGSKKWYALGNLANIDASALKTYQMWQEELQKVGYTLSEIRDTSVGLTADIIPIDGKAITNAEEFRKTLDSITTLPSENVQLLNKQITELESKISSLKSEITSLESSSTDQKKDAFPDSSTNTKPETEGMEQVEKATKEAVQAKKDFATANEGVQSSIDGSENPLKLEAELMEQIAKSAREAAEAKKEFVEANKQVKESAGESNSANKRKDRYANAKKVSSDEFLDRYDEFLAVGNKTASQKGGTILGNSVNISYDAENELVKVSAKIKDVDGTWRSFSAKLSSDLQVFPTGFKTITKGINNLDNELANFGKDEIKAPETDEQVQKFKELNIAIDDYASARKRMANGRAFDKDKEDSQKLLDIINKIMGKADGSVTILSSQQLSDAQDRLDKIDKTISEIRQKSVQNGNNGLFSYSKKLSGYESTLDKLKDGGWASDAYLKNVQAVRDAIKEYATLLNKIKTEQGGIATDEDIQILKEYESEIKKTIATVTNMSASEKGYNFVSGQKELDKIHKLLNENSKMSSGAKAKIQAYYREIESGNPSMSLDKIHGEIMKIYNAEVEAGRAGKSMWSIIKSSGLHQITAQMAGMFGFYDVINIGKQAIEVVTELDSAFTEMRKVSDETTQSLKNYQKTTFSTANDVGTTAMQIQNSTADWQRLGYSLDEASELAKNSNIYKNVGDMDINEATEHMISSVQAWKSEFNGAVTASEEIMNRYNKIGNEFAISSADIGEAMETSAAALKAGGNDLNESIGLITAGNLIQQDASTTASAMKILSLRIRGAKADLDAMGESTDDLSDSTSKMREELKALTGVDIMKDENTFKSTAEIIQEMGKNWDKLTDVSKAAALEKLAGKNRASTVSGLIENYATIGKVIEAAENSENSALEENEKYLESIEGRTQKLTNQLQELASVAIKDDWIKDAISGLTTLLNLVTKLVDKIGIIPTILSSVGIFKGIKTFSKNLA